MDAVTSTFLRAEIDANGARLVGYTTRITPDVVFIRIDELLPLGTEFALELTFARLVDTMRFRAVATKHQHSSGPGDLAGLWADITPREPEDADRLRSVLEGTTSGRALRLLLVEDSALARDVFVFHAQRPSTVSVQVDAVEDADLAWRRATSGTYDLVLVDHFLPSASGAELVAQLRADPRTCGLPIIGTSVGGSLARDSMLNAGADMFLDKPLHVKALISTLDLITACRSNA